MDLNRLIKKVKKKLGRSLNFSMKGLGELLLLKEDVLKLEEILSHHDSSRVYLLAHYKQHAWGLVHCVERIEMELNFWIERLEEPITSEEQDLTARDKQYFELLKTNIDICKNNLIRILAKGGELHKLTHAESPDWRRIEAKVNEAMGNDQSHGIRNLIVLLKNLERAEKRLGQYTAQEITQKEYQKRLEQLKKWGFSVGGHPQLADFLVKHWDGTIEMVKAFVKKKNSWQGELFMYGLPYVEDLINEKTWPGMVEIAKATGGDINDLFNHDLSNVKDLIKEKPWVWPGMVEMAKATGEDAGNLFRGTPVVTHPVNQVWFRGGLPAVKGIINKRNWLMIVEGVKHASKYTKEHLGFIPRSILSDLKPLMNFKSVHDLDKHLVQQTLLAKRYFNEVGFTVYTKKIVNENFWNFTDDERIFNRLKFEKTRLESEKADNTLIPLGGRFKTKYLIRTISQKSYEAWKKAQEANIPIEEIVRAYSAKDGNVRVYCKYAGEQLFEFVRKHPKLRRKMYRQQNKIIKSLENLGIRHGHLHDGNFTVAEENGKLVVRVIDFDQAVS